VKASLTQFHCSRVRALVFLVGFHCSGRRPSEQLRAVYSSTIHTRGLALSPPRRCTPRSAPARPLFSRPAPANLISPQYAIRLCLTRPIRCITLAAAVVHSLQYACLHPSIQHPASSPLGSSPIPNNLGTTTRVPARNTYTPTPRGMGYRRPDTLPDSLVLHVAQRSRSAAD
jgi:hypothetical protein